jgi:transcriptional regulator with XRE-family HTH domain
MTGTRRQPNPIDAHVGSRIRVRRKALGLSQQTLADHLGLTFQQVQKYERGTNRVSASILYEIASSLSAPVSYFFDGLRETGKAGAGAAEAAVQTAFMADRRAVEMMAAFVAIAPSFRTALLTLAKGLAEEAEPAAAHFDLTTPEDVRFRPSPDLGLRRERLGV